MIQLKFFFNSPISNFCPAPWMSFYLTGLRPSQIGVILRDSHGVAQVRRVTGNKIVRILKAKVRNLIS